MKLMLYLYIIVTGFSNSHMNKNMNRFILFFNRSMKKVAWLINVHQETYQLSTNLELVHRHEYYI